MIQICGAIGAAAPYIGVLLVGGTSGVIALYCILAAGRHLIDPGETDPDHPKYRILAHDR